MLPNIHGISGRRPVAKRIAQTESALGKKARQHTRSVVDSAEAPRATATAREAAKPKNVEPVTDVLHSAPTLGWWNAYFLGKLALFWYGVIGLHPLENLAFALVLLVPIQARWLAPLRTAIAIPIAVALAYYDSWLPPFERLIAQASQVATFSLPYMIELAGRFVSWSAVLALVAAMAAYASVAKHVRVGVVVVSLLCGLAVADRWPQQAADQHAVVSDSEVKLVAANMAVPVADAETDLDRLLANHFTTEAARQVRFNRPAASAMPFDLVLLHVCSLSWDDLRVTGLDQHPLFARFDILLTRFNAAASYSGPAVIRLLRAPCGQSNHTDLYSPAPEHCYLLSALRQAGFEPQLAMNHDGHGDRARARARRGLTRRQDADRRHA